MDKDMKTVVRSVRMNDDTVERVSEKLRSDDNLFVDRNEGKYVHPEVHWSYTFDGMGRVTFVGEVSSGKFEDGWDMLYIFPLTEFDLEGFKECVDEAVLDKFGPCE
ncbi:MAG: hypothetical protein LLG45_12575 [Actinomycetia bacterium]|nr:hypothetical protein [Actinomycetes bacterium]